MAERTADVIVIGAGIIGASIAYHLVARDPALHVLVLEADDAPGLGATSKATGSIRLQFATEANIRLSLLSLPYFLQFEQRFGVNPFFRQHGYLFITADRDRWAAMESQCRLQQQLGVPTERLSTDRLAALCPPLYTGDLAGGQFCPWDGSLDPHSVLHGFLAAFRARGGSLRVRAPVTGLSPAASGGAWRVETAGGWLEAGAVVIAAGARSREVAALAGLDVPAHPYRRQVFVMEPHPALRGPLPLTVDLDTGWYVHVDRSNALLLGGTDKDARPGMHPEIDWAGFDGVCRAAVRRMPVLAEARLRRAVVGVRTLTPDHHAILGPADGAPGLYLACGFSGHGIMHSPAVGLLLAEWITAGAPQTWDARCLTVDRFRRGALLEEKAVF